MPRTKSSKPAKSHQHYHVERLNLLNLDYLRYDTIADLKEARNKWQFYREVFKHTGATEEVLETTARFYDPMREWDHGFILGISQCKQKHLQWNEWEEEHHFQLWGSFTDLERVEYEHLMARDTTMDASIDTLNRIIELLEEVGYTIKQTKGGYFTATNKKRKWITFKMWIAEYNPNAE